MTIYFVPCGKEARILAEKFTTIEELREAFIHLCVIASSYPNDGIIDAIERTKDYCEKRGII